MIDVQPDRAGGEGRAPSERPRSQETGRNTDLLFIACVLLPVLLLFLPAAFAGVDTSILQALYPLVVFSPVGWAVFFFGLESRGEPRSPGARSPFHGLLPEGGRGAWLWILMSLLAIPALALLALAIGHVAFDLQPEFPRYDWRVMVPAAALVFLVPGFAEEPGWRGFLQPRLSRRLGPLLGSIAVGATWGVWHMTDLVMFPDTFTLSTYAPKFLWIVGASLTLGWLYHRSGDSLLAAMAGHFGGNLAFKFVPITPWDGYAPHAFWIHVALVWALGLALMTLAKPRSGVQSAPLGQVGGPPFR